MVEYQDINISRYPVFSTYQDMGMTKGEIESDLIATIQRRFYQMTDEQKEDMNLTEETFTTTNIYRLIDEDRISVNFFDMITINGIEYPSYNMEIDIDGDGLFSILPNSNSSEAGWVPQKPVNRYNSTTYEQAKKEKYAKMNAAHLADDPNPSALKKAWWTFLDVAKLQGGEVIGEIENELRELTGIDFGKGSQARFSAENVLELHAQENQQEILLLEAAMADREDMDNFNIIKGDLVMTQDGRIVRSDNAFFDLISKNEGFEGKVYDAQKYYLSGGMKGQFGKGSHRDLMKQAYQLMEEGAISKITGKKFETRQEALDSLMNPMLMGNMEKWGMYDPTVGHGFSLNNKDAMDSLINGHTGTTSLSQKYTIEGLMNGSEFLTMSDSINVFLDVVITQKQNYIKALYPDIDFTNAKNSPLYLALTDMAYVTNKWVKEGTFHNKHMNLYLKTGDKTHIGDWNTAAEDTVLGQMRIDADMAITKGLTGHFHRLEQDAFLIKKWMDGGMIWKQEDDPEL